jgi:hypothetical protein
MTERGKLKIPLKERTMSPTHRTFPINEPKGEVAVVQRPDNLIKIVIYPEGGEKGHQELLFEKKAAFELAMEMLQHLYRLGESR